NRLVDQLTDPVVEAIKRPVILMVLDEVVKVVETGNIPLGLAAALRENSDELGQLVVEKLNEDPTTGRLAMLPFSDRITRAMIETTLRVVLEVLADPRVDEFVTDVVRQNQQRIREDVLNCLQNADCSTLGDRLRVGHTDAAAAEVLLHRRPPLAGVDHLLQRGVARAPPVDLAL